MKNKDIACYLTDMDKIVKPGLFPKGKTRKAKLKELQKIIDNISEGLFLIDTSKRLNYINNTGKELYNKLGQPSSIPIRYYDFRGIEVSIEKDVYIPVLNGQTVRNYAVFASVDGKDIYLSINGSPIYNDEGEITHGVLSFCDITAEITYKTEITDKRDQLKNLIECMPEAISLFDRDGRIIMLNESAQKFYANVTENINDIHKYCKFYYITNREEIPPEKMPHKIVINEHKVVKDIIIIKTPKKKLYVGISGTPVFDSNGNFIMGAICGRDISNHIEFEENLRQAEVKQKEALENAMTIKDEFLALISHEFKTPLTVITSAIQAMEYLCRGSLSEKAIDFIRIIRQNTYRQQRLVNNILDITRINAGHIKLESKNKDIVFLTKAITESVQIYAEQKGLNVYFLSALDRHFIGVDEEKYERVILNLLSNAIKFTPYGGTITVKLFLEKSMICIDVKDSGIGIPEDKLELIFEKFGQVDSSLSRQAEGTGIGLSLVKMFVEAMNGSIVVKSSPENGSCFTVKLPDELIPNDDIVERTPDLAEKHLIQTALLEFSDVYL